MANKKHLTMFDRTTVKTPCDAAWEEMTGSDEVRFCRHCAKNVHNISAMTRKEAKKLVAASNGKICIRYARKPDGKIQTQPTRFHQITRQTGIAAGILVTSLSVSSVVYAQGRAVKAKPQTSVQQTSTDNRKTDNPTSQISFTVYDQMGATVSHAQVMLINQTTKKEFVINANEEGVARFGIIPFGRYEIRAHSRGFQDLTGRIIEIQNAIEPNINVTLLIGFVGSVVTVDSYELPMLQAIAQGDVEAIKQLIASGANVNAKDKGFNNGTALHVAVESGNLEIVQMLIDAGANVNVKNKSEQTPLLMIDEDATPEIVRLLIARGADVNAQNDEGETALMLASDENKIEIVRILLEAGANPNLRNEDDETALSNADDEKIKNLLKQYGAKEN